MENTIDNKVNCLICDHELEYLDHMEKMECVSCHRTFDSNCRCQAGHFICDECHSRKGIEIVKTYCPEMKSKNPKEVLNRLMAHESIHMHGPEHHVLVGAALLTAYKNAGGDIDLDKALDEMIARGRKVPGGVCGMWGSCGAAVSSGIFYSIISGASPLTEDSWGRANTMTSRILARLGEIGGPRCCKRNGYIAVEEAVKYVEEIHGIKMELETDTKCNYTEFNAQCIKERCPFYPGN